MWSAVFVYVLLVASTILGGALATRFLFPVSSDVRKMVDEDTCRRHGKFLCETCFDLSVCHHPLYKRWLDHAGQEFCECGAEFGVPSRVHD